MARGGFSNNRNMVISRGRGGGPARFRFNRPPRFNNNRNFKPNREPQNRPNKFAIYKNFNRPQGFRPFRGGPNQRARGARSFRGGLVNQQPKREFGIAINQRNWNKRGRGRPGSRFSRGKGFRGFRRGFRGRGGPYGSVNRENLDADLDAYMGDDATKTRLDNDLDMYFSRTDMQPEIKQDPTAMEITMDESTA